MDIDLNQRIAEGQRGRAEKWGAQNAQHSSIVLFEPLLSPIRLRAGVTVGGREKKTKNSNVTTMIIVEMTNTAASRLICATEPAWTDPPPDPRLDRSEKEKKKREKRKKAKDARAPGALVFSPIFPVYLRPSTWRMYAGRVLPWSWDEHGDH